MLLQDRVAIITGGARGIGRGIALKFADEGCSVAIADLNTDEAKITLDELSKKGKEGLFVKCDVADSKQVHDVVDKVINKFGKIDILINDAGIHPAQYTIVDLPEKEWDRILAVDLKGEFLFCQAVAPYMIKRKYGKIVNISSLAASHPPHPSVHYSAAKAGVLGLTYDLAVELASYNITVNAIQPGAVRTPLWDGALSVVANKDAFFADLAKADIPLQRIGTPDDLAGAALFLASDLSAYVTGISILVAGGQPLRPLFEIKEK
jgi:NAD(P)-dependent dehydrogenase (short-subunit alcohol dehydrogenase family)